MPLKKWSIHGMKSLTCIKIDGGCSKLEVFPQEVLPNTLTYLCIRNLPNLINLGEGLTVSPHWKSWRLNTVRRLISWCQRRDFPSNYNLCLLPIVRASCLAQNGVCMEWSHWLILWLQVDVVRWSCFLKGICCQTVSFLFASADFQISNTWSMGFSNSHRSKIWRSTVVRSLSWFKQRDGLPASLSSLRIRKCSLLALRCKKDGGEDWPKISHVLQIE